MAEGVPKVVTGKGLEGGGRLEEGAFLGLFHPNTVKARDGSGGLPRALPVINF